jgi:hypothetical protein
MNGETSRGILIRIVPKGFMQIIVTSVIAFANDKVSNTVYRDYRVPSNFWKFYLIRTRFTLGEPVSLVTVFRLFKLEQMFFGVRSVDTVGRCTISYLLVGPACL